MLIVARGLAVLLRLGLSVSRDIILLMSLGIVNCCADVIIAEFGAE